MPRALEALVIAQERRAASACEKLILGIHEGHNVQAVKGRDLSSRSTTLRAFGGDTVSKHNLTALDITTVTTALRRTASPSCATRVFPRQQPTPPAPSAETQARFEPRVVASPHPFPYRCPRRPRTRRCRRRRHLPTACHVESPSHRSMSSMNCLKYLWSRELPPQAPDVEVVLTSPACARAEHCCNTRTLDDRVE